MRAVFVDANPSLGAVFQRLRRPEDLEVTINLQPDVVPEELPGVLAGHEIAIIDHGTVVAHDSTPSLLARAETKTLVVDPGEWAGDLPPLPEAVKAERRRNGTLALTYAPGQMQADQIIDRLRAAGVPMLDLQTEQPDLEDVFRQLTG